MKEAKEQRKSGHGGARPGAGRPRISEDDKNKKRNHAFYCTTGEKLYLRAVLEQIRSGNLDCTISEASRLFDPEQSYWKNIENGHKAWFKSHE